MGLFRKKRKESNFFPNHPSLLDLCKSYYARLHTYLRIKGRTKLANRWARKHPKKLVSIYVSVSIFLLSMCIITSLEDFSNADKGNALDIERISSLNKTFDNLHKREINENLIRDQLSNLGKKGLELTHELDSLMRLDVKTHSDSLRINSIYNILKSTFNYDQNHENRSEEN